MPKRKKCYACTLRFLLRDCSASAETLTSVLDEWPSWSRSGLLKMGDPETFTFVTRDLKLHTAVLNYPHIETVLCLSKTCAKMSIAALRSSPSLPAVRHGRKVCTRITSGVSRGLNNLCAAPVLNCGQAVRVHAAADNQLLKKPELKRDGQEQKRLFGDASDASSPASTG